MHQKCAEKATLVDCVVPGNLPPACSAWRVTLIKARAILDKSDGFSIPSRLDATVENPSRRPVVAAGWTGKHGPFFLRRHRPGRPF